MGVDGELVNNPVDGYARVAHSYGPLGKIDLTVNAKAMREQSEFTQEFFANRKEAMPKGKGVPGGSYTTGYALMALAADGVGRWLGRPETMHAVNRVSGVILLGMAALMLGQHLL